MGKTFGNICFGIVQLIYWADLALYVVAQHMPDVHQKLPAWFDSFSTIYIAAFTVPYIVELVARISAGKNGHKTSRYVLTLWTLFFMAVLTYLCMKLRLLPVLTPWIPVWFAGAAKYILYAEIGAFVLVYFIGHGRFHK